MALLGESFKDYVKKQINVRQDRLALENKDNDTLKYITSKTSFLRLTSGVDISEDIAQSLGVIGLSGHLLAKQYVLEAAKFDNQFTSNVGYSPEEFTTSYGFNSDPNYGLVPPPGLISAEVKTLNRGAIREATINLVCHNIYQFKIINALFLKLKYSLLLEWGHTLYFNNDSTLSTPIDAFNLSDDFLTSGISSDEILEQIEETRDKSSGNYDAFFGVIKNFNWDLQENGSYSVTINAISQGSIIESLKANTNFTPNENIAGDEPQYQKSTLHKILGEIIKKIGDGPGGGYRGYLHGYITAENEIGLNSTNVSAFTGVSPNPTDPLDTNKVGGPNSILANNEGIAITFPSLQLDKDSNPLPQYYIKLGALLRIIESFILYYDLSKTTENGTPPSIFYIDHNFNTNECLTTPKQISIDPFTCLIPFDFENSSDETKTVYSTFNSVTETYTYTTDALGTLITAVSSSSPIISNQLDNPNREIPEDRQAAKTVVGTSVTFSNGTTGTLTLVTPNFDPLQDALLKIQQNAGSFGNSTITITTQTITKNTKYAINNESQLGTLTYLNKEFRTDNKFIGKTMHIYVNINKIIEVLDRNVDNDGNVSIYSFLTSLLNDLRLALGSINKFDLDYDSSTNRFSIIDSAVIPFKYENLNKDEVAKFNINLLKDKTKDGGSFVTNFGLKSEVFSKVANAIALGAQDNGNTMIANSTPLSNFNQGLTDRIITTKLNSNTKDFKQNQGFDQFGAAYIAYEEYKNKLVSTAQNIGSTSDSSLTLADIDLYKNYLVDLFNYDVGTYTKNGHIPGTGFIPLNLQLTMDGLSGITQYQAFNVDETLLPSEYQNRLGFITTTVTHKIDIKGWETTLNSLSIPKKFKSKETIITAPAPKIKTEAKKTVDISNTPPAESGGAYKIRNQGVYKTEYWKMGVHHSVSATSQVSTPGGDWNVGFRKSNYIGFFTTANSYKTIEAKNSNREYAVFDFTLFRNDSSDVDIPAPFDGKVVAQGVDTKGNSYMALLGTDGAKTAMILHMRAVYKKKGDTFVRGEKIAIQANVGPSSTGVHTHVELISIEDFVGWWNLIIGLPETYTGLSSNEPINVA